MNFKIFSILSLLLLLSNSLHAEPKFQSERAIQNEVLVHINKYRVAHGLGALKMDERITEEAKRHSKDMANHSMPFGHNEFGKRMQRLHRKIANSGAGAENVAYNYKDAPTVVKNWLLSRGHKYNIDGNYNITGVGVVRDKQGKLYYTQIFMRTGVPSQQATRRPRTRIFASLF